MITCVDCRAFHGRKNRGAQLYECTIYMEDRGEVGVEFICGARLDGKIVFEGPLPRDCILGRWVQP